MANMTRRDFVRASALASTTLWVKGRAWAQGPSPNAKIRVGMIGVGGRGGSHLEPMQGEHVVALCDVDDNTLAKAAKMYPEAKHYFDYREMIANEKLDAVVVAIPDHNHAPAAMMALKKKLHVYCEKPLTHSIHEARMLTQAAKEAGVVTQMGNQGHSMKGVRQVIEIVRTGVIGTVKSVHCWTNRPIWPQGLDRPAAKPVPAGLHWDQWLGPAPERPYQDNLHPFAWRGWWDFGTGALGDMACHVMDQAYWSLELGHPVAVEAKGDPRKPESAPNWETVTLDYPARGNWPAIQVTWYDGLTEITGTDKGGKRERPKGVRNLPPADLAPGEDLSKHECGTLFVGEKGTLLVHDAYGANLKMLGKGFEGYKLPEPTIVPESTGDPRSEWLQAIHAGKQAGSNFGYAGPFTESILVGVVAFRTGKKLEWDAAAMKAKGCPEADKYIKREYRKGWTL